MNGNNLITQLKPLFQPRSVAVIGASNDRNKWGNSTFISLIKSFTGDLYAVNNHSPEIQGYSAYKKVIDIPGHVDLVVIVAPPEYVAGVMEDSVIKGVKAAVIITAGFAEVGPEGKILQDQVMEVARRGSIRIVGPNCMGMWSAAGNLPAFMFPMRILDGPLALVSQGGNIGGALVADATFRGIGFKYYVSCGCTADIQIGDYIEYMGQDDSVKVIMVYIEGLSINNRFVEKVSKVTRKKPVIVLKLGKTMAAAKAISSHSGSLAGLDSIYDAAFKKAGVTRVNSTTEMLDTALAFLTQPLPKGRNIVITTPGGSYGVLCAEACALRGLNVIDLPENILEKFNAMFPARWSHGNPVDPAGDRDFIQYLRAPEMLLQCPEVDAIIFMGFGSFSGMSSVFASDVEDSSYSGYLDGLSGFQEMAKQIVTVLDSGDEKQIKVTIVQLIQVFFDAMMPKKATEIEEFLETVSNALTTAEMLRSQFFTNLARFFNILAVGDFKSVEISDILDLIEPMIGAYVNGLIAKYNKPVITTTFTEENTRMSETGHFPFPNSDRASTVLAKMVEYREYLERNS